LHAAVLPQQGDNALAASAGVSAFDHDAPAETCKFQQRFKWISDLKRNAEMAQGQSLLNFTKLTTMFGENYRPGSPKMSQRMNLSRCCALVASLTLVCGTAVANNRASVLGSIEGMGLSARAYADGTYSIAASGIAGPVIHSNVEAVVDSVVLSSTAYPRHEVEQ